MTPHSRKRPRSEDTCEARAEGETSHLADKTGPPDEHTTGGRPGTSWFPPPTRAREGDTCEHSPPFQSCSSGSDVTRNSEHLGREAQRTGQKIESHQWRQTASVHLQPAFPRRPSAKVNLGVTLYRADNFISPRAPFLPKCSHCNLGFIRCYE